MPKLKSYRRIITSDFDEKDKKLVENLGLNVNDAFQDLFFAVNGRLDLRTNIACSVKDIDVTVDSAGAPVARTVFTVNNPGVPIIGITVIYAINQNNSAIYPTSAPWVSYVQIDGGILITNITGLQAGQRYSIRLIAWN